MAVLDVTIADVDFDSIEVDEAAEFADYYDLSITVLADVDGTWKPRWGPSRHTFTVVDSAGLVTWHQIGTDGDPVQEMIDQALAAP